MVLLLLACRAHAKNCHEVIFIMTYSRVLESFTAYLEEVMRQGGHGLPQIKLTVTSPAKISGGSADAAVPFPGPL